MKNFSISPNFSFHRHFFSLPLGGTASFELFGGEFRHLASLAGADFSLAEAISGQTTTTFLSFTHSELIWSLGTHICENLYLKYEAFITIF